MDCSKCCRSNFSTVCTYIPTVNNCNCRKTTANCLQQYCTTALDDEENFIESMMPFIRGMSTIKKMQLKTQFQTTLLHEMLLNDADCTECCCSPWPPFKTTKPICYQDEDEIFFFGLIPHIKSLDPAQRLAIRKKFFNDLHFLYEHHDDLSVDDEKWKLNEKNKRLEEQRKKLADEAKQRERMRLEAEREKKRLEDELKREEEMRKKECERIKLENEAKKLEEQRRELEKQRKIEEEAQRLKDAEDKRKREEEMAQQLEFERRMDEAKWKLEEERRQIEEDNWRAEEEKRQRELEKEIWEQEEKRKLKLLRLQDEENRRIRDEQMENLKRNRERAREEERLRAEREMRDRERNRLLEEEQLRREMLEREKERELERIRQEQEANLKKFHKRDIHKAGASAMSVQTILKPSMYSIDDEPTPTTQQTDNENLRSISNASFYVHTLKHSSDEGEAPEFVQRNSSDSGSQTEEYHKNV